MKNKYKTTAIWVLAALSPILCAIAFPFLPDQIPMHWAIDGSVTHQGKGTLFFLALLSPLLAAMFFALPKIDPKKDNYARFSKYYSLFGIFLMSFLLIANLIVLSESFFPGRISVGMVVQILVGALFLFLGNIMPKVKSNFFMGVKNPWTLSNTDIWNRTHRLAGFLMFIMGLIIILTCFWLPPAFSMWLIVGMGTLLAVLPTVLSYIWYRKLLKSLSGNESEEEEK